MAASIVELLIPGSTWTSGVSTGDGSEALVVGLASAMGGLGLAGRVGGGYGK
jgi:hypothetical protein